MRQNSLIRAANVSTVALTFQPLKQNFGDFLRWPLTSLAGLQSTVTTLPYADYETEVLASLRSIPMQVGSCK